MKPEAERRRSCRVDLDVGNREQTQIIIETEQQPDGRWSAEALAVLNCLAYADTETEAVERCKLMVRAVEKVESADALDERA